MEKQISEINLKNTTSLLTSPKGHTPRKFITLKEGLRLLKVWHLVGMAFCSAFYGLYLASVYKSFGLR